MENKIQPLIIDDTRYETEVPEGYNVRAGNGSDPREIRAVIPGIIVGVKVRKGQKISAGQVVVLLEAMKMFNDVEAEIDGKVADVNVSEGDRVTKGQLMIRLG